MTAPVEWSILVAPLDGVDGTDEPWLSESRDAVLRTASIGKLQLLSLIAELAAAGELDLNDRVRWEDEEFVRDSGLWHALDQRDLSIVDACRLVGAVSDNLATNVLIRHVGLEAIADFATRNELAPMALLDRIRGEGRDPSLPGVAETLSKASATSLLRYLRLVHDGTLDRRVLEWLGLGSDLSMVAAAFGLDPLAHAEDDRGFLLINKTGTDSSVRADVGWVTHHGRTVGYAVLANWAKTVAAEEDPRDDVLLRLRQIGDDLRTRLANVG